ncbi:MAG: hypothetical protein LHV68_01835 [Elusimicrobia bacterium]|nr:hypothetical protein [Candidatus Liberimonas magnetica]
MKKLQVAAVSMMVALFFLGCGNKGFKPFYVYKDGRLPMNHYVPTGVMGDFGDITIIEDSTENPQEGLSCIKITYTAKAASGQRWAGVYWQEPANNWAKLEKGGFDLTGATRLVFWVRGEKGGETISEFKVGGMQGDFPDTALYNIGPVVLTKEWKEYEIPFDVNPNLKRLAGGFCFAASQKDNPQGFVIYLDNIVYR